MGVRNQDWYNLAESSSYPFQVESASLVSDEGQRLTPGILCDLQLRFPATSARYAFLGACTVTRRIATAIILGSTSPTTAENVIALAAVSIPQPVDIYRPYPLEALAEGVGGWIVFGHGIKEDFSGRFSHPAQSLFLPRAARAYSALPVRDLGKQGRADALSGVVRLHGGNDVEIVGARRRLPGELFERTVGVFRLKTEALAENLLDKYRGPCGGRAESRTCDSPQPVESISGALPDCSGNLTLYIEDNNATSFAILPAVRPNQAAGIVLASSLDMTDLCGERGLPRPTGQLPGEGEEFCSIFSISLSFDGYPDPW